MIIKCISKDFFFLFEIVMQCKWAEMRTAASQMNAFWFVLVLKMKKAKCMQSWKKKFFLFFAVYMWFDDVGKSGWLYGVKKNLCEWGKNKKQTFTRPLCCYCRAQVNEYTNVCKNNLHCVFPFYSSIHFFCSFSSRFKWLVWYYYRTQLICILNAFNYKN